jgi:enoyl-CoA hydratase/carnithine racemase
MEPITRLALVGRHERVTAQRAFELGVISDVVDPPARLREAARELATKLAQNSPAAMAATKRALWAALETGLTDACKAGVEELVGVWGHPDQEEGPLAFTEKREAQWQEIP